MKELLIIVLLKGVPERTTQAMTVTGILNRESMNLVLNPHDYKAVEAAGYVKQAVGGKIIGLTMGPEVKLSPILKQLYFEHLYGIEESVILSDRKMAGADTLATAYAIALGVNTIVRWHTKPINQLIEMIKLDKPKDQIKSEAEKYYNDNLIPNNVFSDLKPIKDSIIQRYVDGYITKDEAIKQLQSEQESIQKFIIIAGIKTTDGETGSVGPQVAEGLSELIGRTVPHATYVEDFFFDNYFLVTERRLGLLVQKVRMELPALITIADEYIQRPIDPKRQIMVRSNNFKGRTLKPIVWSSQEIGADENRLGLKGSPTIVGPGVDVGKPPAQKIVGKTRVFLENIESVEYDGRKFGPFGRGDIADGLPDELVNKLQNENKIGIFGIDMLLEELFR
ncbi:MAG: hypothetical protein QXG05_01830 [Nitrososphaerota archaeon]